MFFLLLWALLLPQGPGTSPQSEPQSQAASSQNAGPPVLEQEMFALVRSKAAFGEQQIVETIQARGIGFRLTDSMRKALRKEGATPAIMAALEKAADELKRRSSAEEATAAAAAAAAAPKPSEPPPALPVDQQIRLIEQVRKNALEYSDHLPNFICLQVTRRMVDFGGQGYWQLMDVIQARLAYNEHRESYQVVTVNNQLTDRSMESLGGAVSTGEFGTLLRDLFLPETQAYFEWAGAAVLRNRPVYAFDYAVPRETSTWHITWQRNHPDERSVIPAYRGRVIVEAENQQVLRLWMQAENIPDDFPVRAAGTTLDYDYASISGRPFLLPSRAVVEMKDGRASSRNEISFRQYRRFTAETKLVFGDTESENPKPETPPAATPAQPPQKPKP